MGERWLVHCHQKFYSQEENNQASAVVLSLRAILPSFLPLRGHLAMFRDIIDG